MTINLKSDMMKRISLIFMLCITCLGLEAQETGRDRRIFNIDSSNGTIWVGTLRELMAYDTKNGNDSLYYQAGMDELDAFIGSIYCAADGNVWIGTWGKGARILKLDGQWTYNVHLSTRDYIMSMDGDGEYIWCGAAAKLIRLNADGSLSGSFSCGDKLSSTHSIVYDIDIDSQDRIWLSEENTGLSKVEDNRMEHMEDYENLPMRQGFLCHKIAVDEGNQCVWGVTDTRHGLHCYNLADASVTTYSQAEGTLPVETVWDVLVDRNGALWLASANGKLVKRQADGTFETFTAENLQNLGVLHEDDEGHIWCGKEKGHLLEFDGEKFIADIDLWARATKIKGIPRTTTNGFKAVAGGGQVCLQWPADGGTLLRADFLNTDGRLIESVNHPAQEQGSARIAPKTLRSGRLYLLKAYTERGGAYATKFIYR